ncbi:MAG: DUF2269 family protein [Myxococcales bacterium]|nr:DUF2269 family protein [Myxococcales bacterium]
MKLPTLSTSAKISLASNAVALGLLAIAWRAPLAAPFSYSTHKVLHVLGALLLLGNLVAGPVWVMLAWFEPGRPHLAFATRALSAADIYLTTPGVQLAAWNGVWLASTFGGVRSQPWIVESVAMLVVTSLLSVTLVLTWQERLVDAAQRGDARGTRLAMTLWGVFGTLVGVPLGLIFYEMVTKQPLVLPAAP